MDPVIEEVRRIRERHAAKYGYDIDAICEALKEEERQSGRRVVTSPSTISVPVPGFLLADVYARDLFLPERAPLVKPRI